VRVLVDAASPFQPRETRRTATSVILLSIGHVATGVANLSPLAGAPRQSGNDRGQFERVDGLGQVDLKASQQRQVCVVLLDERG
jgi:hypothetical protein